MAEAKKVIRKPKTKVIQTNVKPAVDKNYAIIDYSSLTDPNFIEFVEGLWSTKLDCNPSTFPVKYKLCTIIAEIRYHIKEKQSQTQSIAQKYGTYDTNTDNWMIKPEVQQQFQNELNTLNDIKIQSESLKIDIKDLQESNMWQQYPFDNMSLSIIDITSDFVNYDGIEDNNESTIEEQ